MVRSSRIEHDFEWQVALNSIELSFLALQKCHQFRIDVLEEGTLAHTRVTFI